MLRNRQKHKTKINTISPLRFCGNSMFNRWWAGIGYRIIMNLLLTKDLRFCRKLLNGLRVGNGPVYRLYTYNHVIDSKLMNEILFHTESKISWTMFKSKIQLNAWIGFKENGYWATHSHNTRDGTRVWSFQVS